LTIQSPPVAIAVRTEEFVTIQLEQVSASAPPARSRRWWVWAVVSVAFVVLAALVAGWIYANAYMPLAPGGEMSPVVQANLAQIGDGVQTTQWVITGPTGKKASVAYMLANNGPVGITVEGLSGSHAVGWVGSVTAPHSAVLMSLAWTPTVNGSFPVPMKQSAFPAKVPAHGAIAIDVTITKPACKPAYDPEVTEVPIEWSSLGVHHAYSLPLQLGGFFLPIDPCPTRTSLTRTTGNAP
jgi:hypothetical protein